MKVKELIEELKEFNPEAELTVGDNFYNGISISWGFSENGKKNNCEYVCFDIYNPVNNEKKNEYGID